MDEKAVALKVLKVAGMIIGGIALAILFGFLFGILVMFLWNWLMPTLFGFVKIGFWQAVGIIILSKILFSGFGCGGGGGSEKKQGKKNRKWYDEIGDEISKEVGKEIAKECGEKEEPDWSTLRNFWKDEGKQAFHEYKQREKSEGDYNPDQQDA